MISNRVQIVTKYYCLYCAQFGYTPLHRAAAQGHLEVIEELLKRGCPVDHPDDVSHFRQCIIVCDAPSYIRQQSGGCVVFFVSVCR